MLRTWFLYLKKWLKPPRSLRVTGAGWKFIGFTVIVGIAAINTGNNLLYLVFGAMLSFITASGVLSELMLRRVRPTRTFPKHLFAQQAAPVSVKVVNGKKRFASFALLIEDFSQQNAAQHRRYLLKIAPGATETVVYPVTFQRRGLQRPGKIRISTRYPFGLFLKSATFVETEEEMLVYPALEKLAPSELSKFSAALGESGSPKKGYGSEVHSIRDYVHGDERTRVHWKTTAKFARLMTREFEAEQKKKIAVALDVSGASPTRREGFEQDVERAISLAASYVAHFIAQDFQLQLITPTQRTPFERGERHLFRVLRMLALLQPTDGGEGMARAVRQLARADVMKILISINPTSVLPRAGFAKIVIPSSH